MLNLSVIAVTCALAAHGTFNTLAAALGLSGFGDYLAALLIALSVASLAVRKPRETDTC